MHECLWLPCQVSNCYTHFTNEWATVKSQGDGIFVTGLGTAFQRSKFSHREACAQSRWQNQHVDLLFQKTAIEFIPSEVRLHKFIRTSLLAMQTCENRDSVTSVCSWAAFGHGAIQAKLSHHTADKQRCLTCSSKNNRMHREVVDAPCLDTFKATLDRAMSNLT